MAQNFPEFFGQPRSDLHERSRVRIERLTICRLTGHTCDTTKRMPMMRSLGIRSKIFLVHTLLLFILSSLSRNELISTCISDESLMTSNKMILRDHIFQDTPCSLGNGLGNTAQGTVFHNTPPRENIRKESSLPKITPYVCEQLAITN